ncbi:scavenger receptor cysteine-rich type 1 protein M130-like isoform X2 [Liolophura sinensis]|uniref:scavenger receptor cysteine-rich type 1 protein M130-like isoform X2 n=1 Tax=Liolophura sinensis TaxID=3198878 RepID=UPI00315875EA
MMRRGGQWGTICDQNFHNLDAAVICKALDKPSSFSWASTGTNDPKRTEVIWTDRFWCKSINDNWQDCRQKNYMMAGCTHNTDVFVTCGTLDKSSVQYRLSNGPVPMSGVVEIRVNDTWGGICRTGFTHKEAGVVCRSLGLSTAGAEVVNPDIFPTPGDSHIWLGGVKCKGSETSILDCEHYYIGRPRCARLPNAAVAVQCGEAPANRIEDFTLRLVGEADSKPSRVEIMLMGEWGTICDEQFDRDNAKTVCRQLGLPSTLASVADKGTYQPGTGKIWLTNTSCYGFESSIKECEYVLAWSSCDHSQDVGVVCKEFTIDYGSDSRVPVGLIIGVSIGSVAILGAIVIFVMIKFRLFRQAPPVTVPSPVQYSAAPKNSQAYSGSTPPHNQDPLIPA